MKQRLGLAWVITLIAVPLLLIAGLTANHAGWVELPKPAPRAADKTPAPKWSDLKVVEDRRLGPVRGNLKQPLTALPVGPLTAGATASNAVLALSEDLTTDNKAAVLSAIQAHTTVNDLVTTGDIVISYLWTTNSLLTVAVTANDNSGVNPDNIFLTAASFDLLDAAGNKTSAAEIIK
jgi:hypothetical protein